MLVPCFEYEFNYKQTLQLRICIESRDQLLCPSSSTVIIDLRSDNHHGGHLWILKTTICLSELTISIYLVLRESLVALIVNTLPPPSHTVYHIVYAFNRKYVLN